MLKFISMQMKQALKKNTRKKRKKRAKKLKKKKIEKCLDKHSHTAASTRIKTRRQISTWNWLNLQKENVKKKRK